MGLLTRNTGAGICNTLVDLISRDEIYIIWPCFLLVSSILDSNRPLGLGGVGGVAFGHVFLE